MSFLGRFQLVQQSTLPDLERAQTWATKKGDYDKFWKFMYSYGEELGYLYSGSVIFDLFSYLREEKKIDIEKGSMAEFDSAFVEAFGTGCYVYVLLDCADRDRFIDHLDPSHASAVEMQTFFEREYKDKNPNKECGDYMMETLEYLHSNLKNLKQGELLFVTVFE